MEVVTGERLGARAVFSAVRVIKMGSGVTRFRRNTSSADQKSRENQRADTVMARIFSVRDLLWLLVVVAIGIGYWREHQRPRPGRYYVIESADGATLTLVDSKTDVRQVMPAASLDPEDILRRAQKGISENPSPQ